MPLASDSRPGNFSCTLALAQCSSSIRKLMPAWRRCSVASGPNCSASCSCSSLLKTSTEPLLLSTLPPGAAGPHAGRKKPKVVGCGPRPAQARWATLVQPQPLQHTIVAGRCTSLLGVVQAKRRPPLSCSQEQQPWSTMQLRHQVPRLPASALTYRAASAALHCVTRHCAGSCICTCKCAAAAHTARALARCHQPVVRRCCCGSPDAGRRLALEQQAGEGGWCCDGGGRGWGGDSSPCG